MLAAQSARGAPHGHFGARAWCPGMLIEGQFPVAAPPQALIGHLFDAKLMASCLPGCETLEPLDGGKYHAVVAVAMAGIKAQFDLEVQVTRQDEFNVWAITRGQEGGNASSLQADSHIRLEPEAGGTLLSYRSDVSITGRLGRFALGMMKKKAQNLGDEFAANLRARLEQLAELGQAIQAAPQLVLPQPGPACAAPARAPRSWWLALLKWLRGTRNSAAHPGN